MKNVLYGLMLLALLLVPAKPVFALEGHLDGRVVIGQDFTLKSGETVDGDLVVIGAEAIIENNAQVNGDIIVIGGSLKLNGRATGSAVVVGGLISVGDQASLTGDVVTVGGSLQRAEGAHIGGNILTNLPPPTIPLLNAPNTGSPSVPPEPVYRFNFGVLGTVIGAFFQALGLAALAMLLTVFLHPQLDRVAHAVVSQPLMSGSIGLLTVFVAPIAVVILVVTLILIPVALAVAFMLVLAGLFGIVALGMEVGDRFTKAIHQTWEPVLSAGLGAFLLAIVVSTVNLIPCVGWLASVLVGLLGLGAAVITLFGTRSVYAIAPLASAGPTAGGPPPPV